MTQFSYHLSDRIGTKATLGMVVLSSDQTLEHDMRRMLPIEDVALYVSRIHCETDVTGDTLSQMEERLPASVGLFPPGMSFDSVGYGCTSGTSVIGPEAINRIVSSACDTKAVTEPVSGLIAACRHLSIKKLAFLTPYVLEVSQTLMNVVNQAGVETPLFGSFDEGDDTRVARVDPKSIFDAAIALAEGQDCDGVFMSCTNLRTLDIIPQLEDRLGIPALASNQVMAWHMAQQAGLQLNTGFGRLIDA